MRTIIILLAVFCFISEVHGKAIQKRHVLGKQGKKIRNILYDTMADKLRGIIICIERVFVI